jgi:ribosomal protein L37AE/L43A
MKYGTENPFQNEDVKSKSRATAKAKYGTEYFSQSEEYKNRIYTCPHCEKTTINPGMIKRWHGDNCKHKPKD